MISVSFSSLGAACWQLEFDCSSIVLIHVECIQLKDFVEYGGYRLVYLECNLEEAFGLLALCRCQAVSVLLCLVGLGVECIGWNRGVLKTRL